MQPDLYTADAVCRSMGLAGFLTPTPPSPSLRVVFLPAFHPEVCMTLSGPADGARLTVVALTESLWRQDVPRRLPAVCETVAVPAGEFRRADEAFSAAFARRDQSTRWVCLDGMRAECGRSAAGEWQRVSGHTHRPPVSGFVARLIRLGWLACRRRAVRNAVAACGRYVDETYPVEPEPPAVRLLVLGADSARADFYDRM